MAPPSRRWTCARKTTRRSPPNSRRRPSAAPKKRLVPPKRPRAKPRKRRPRSLRQPPPTEPTKTSKPKRGHAAGVGARGAAPHRRGPLEGTFDHGEEGYGQALDPAIQDDPIYAEHWAGHRPIEITIEEDQIVIRRAGGAATTTTKTVTAIAAGGARGGAQSPADERSSRGSTALVRRTPSAPTSGTSTLRQGRGRAAELPLDRRAELPTHCWPAPALQARTSRTRPWRRRAAFFEAPAGTTDAHTR